MFLLKLINAPELPFLGFIATLQAKIRKNERMNFKKQSTWKVWKIPRNYTFFWPEKIAQKSKEY